VKKIVRMVFGSHMYGLNTPESDLDYKGIYLPELDDLLLGKHAKHISLSTGNDKSKNSKDDIDDDWFSLDEFIKLATKGETVALDMLHVNPEMVKVEIDPIYGHIWEELVEKREEFYTKNLKAYMGYVKRQAAKYGLKGSRIAAMREAIAALKTHAGSELLLHDIWLFLPINEFANTITLAGKNGIESNYYEVNGKKYQSSVSVDYALERIQKGMDAYGARALLAEKNEGVDWKAVSHALRAGFQLRQVLNEGTFTYPLAETEYLRNVKGGKLDYTTKVQNVLETLIEEIDSLVLASDLPLKVNFKYWDKWLVDVYKNELF